MTFTLTGFEEGKGGVRRFAFQCVAADRSKTNVIVDADVSLARKYQIRLQELPLLCVRLLESLDSEGLAGAITLTEERMNVIQAAARLAAEKKPRNAPRRPLVTAADSWRDGRP